MTQDDYTQLYNNINRNNILRQISDKYYKECKTKCSKGILTCTKYYGKTLTIDYKTKQIKYNNMKGSELSQKSIRYIKDKYNGYVVNVITANTSGTPDLLACIKGKFFAFEIKGKGDSNKLLQSLKLNEVTRAGGYGGYVRSLNDIDNIVKKLLKFRVKTERIKL